MIDLPVSPPPDLASHEDSLINSGSYVFRDEAVLGSRMRLDLVARNYADALAAAIGVRSEIDRLNAILSTHVADSELAALNDSRSHRASPELFAVVAAAERWREATQGAFSGRLGHALELWQTARDKPPCHDDLKRLAREAHVADVRLIESDRMIVRPDAVKFALDALAKGWIVERAYATARAAAGVTGALIEVGGDLRCGGRSPESRRWHVDILDARIPADNARRIVQASLSDCALATSGRGVRDRVIGGTRYSPTLSPLDGWPVDHTIAVTAAASSATDADALATALLAMSTEQALRWADGHRHPAILQTRDNVIWTQSSRASAPEVRFSQVQSALRENAGSWPKDWLAYITFKAPPRQLIRDQHFRSPYMAMWIADLDNKPIRTLLLVGKEGDWQRDNYIWWSTNNARVQELLRTRSMSTSGSGIYKVLWDGTDDQYRPVPGGTYILHVETSQERGKHTHRSLTLDFSQARRFNAELPSTEEGGGVQLDFYRP